MRHNTQDKTLYRKYIRKWKLLIQEYELVKQKQHPQFRFAAACYRFHQTHRQTFFKYYHRFHQQGTDAARSGKAGRATGLVSSKCCSTGSGASTARRFANSWPRNSSTCPRRRVRCIG